MDYSNDFLIKRFLDKNYIIKESTYFVSRNDTHEWGSEIVRLMHSVFSIDADICIDYLKNWSKEKGVRDWGLVYKPKTLTTKYSNEMITDLQALGVTRAEEQLVDVVILELLKEVNSDILREHYGKLKTFDELLSLALCVGYQTKPNYDTHTFVLMKHFESAKYDDIKNERNINPHWQDWIRTRK